MTFDERVEAVTKKGFTERQARFLTTVMLQTGVCVPRQYARFCGIVYGEKTRKFYARLVRLQYASMYDCRHNRARIYHVNQRTLYAAIGDADSRLRKPVTLNHAIQRLMVLDAIVEDPDLVWLGTADEKAAHLSIERVAEKGRLFRCGAEVDDDVAEEERGTAERLRLAFPLRKGEDVGRPVDPPVAAVEPLHPAVADEKDPDLSVPSGGKTEEPLRVPFYLPETYPYRPLVIPYQNHRENGRRISPPTQAPFRCLSPERSSVPP